MEQKQKLYIGSNLKMYKNRKETVDYLTELTDNLKQMPDGDREVFILPSFTALESALRCVSGCPVRIGAQNMHWEDKGQYTGEISPPMLKELGVDLVMAGHSERRSLSGETDEEENKKVIAALNHGFTVLLCIGETEDEKECGTGAETLRKQIKTGLHGIAKGDAERIWIAYEPVWSIGVGGKPASASYAEEMHQIIKGALFEMLGEKGSLVPVLYGGSVNRDNARELIGQKSVDGLFIGRSAWQAGAFTELINMTDNIVKKCTKKDVELC